MAKKLVILLIVSLMFTPPLAISEDRVKIGVLIPLSGEFKSWGDLVRQGIEQAKDPDTELIYGDTACKPKQTLTSFKKLTEIDQVHYLIGPSCGSPQKTIAPLLKGKKMIAMLTSSASEDLYKMSGGKIYAPQYSIEQESSFNAAELNKRGLKSVVMVSMETDFSLAHENAFKKVFKGKVLESIRFTSFDAIQAKNAALKIKKLDPEAIYLPDVSSMMLGFLSELAKIKARDIPVFSIYSAQMPDVLKAEGLNAEGLIYSYPKIKQKDAFSFFPRLGTEIITQAALHCKNNVRCAKKFLSEQYSFDSNNIRKSEIELRTIKDGKFAALRE